MCCTTSETEGDVVHINQYFIADVPMRQFCCGSLLLVLCQIFGDVSPYVCSYYFSSISVAG